MALTTTTRSTHRLAVMQGILPWNRSGVPTDVIAGVTLAALAIPEVMGYTSIAGMPVITGLYTILIPLLLFALLGSSRHLVVGADSATAAILAAGLAGLATAKSDQYVALAGMVALMAAGLLIIARLVGLGFLADFMSRTVLIGFLTGVGIQVACGQVGGMLGLPAGSGVTIDGRTVDNTIAKLWSTLENIADISWTTVAVSAGVIVVILGGKTISPKVPGALDRRDRIDVHQLAVESGRPRRGHARTGARWPAEHQLPLGAVDPTSPHCSGPRPRSSC